MKPGDSGGTYVPDSGRQDNIDMVSAAADVFEGIAAQLEEQMIAIRKSIATAHINALIGEAGIFAAQSKASKRITTVADIWSPLLQAAWEGGVNAINDKRDELIDIIENNASSGSGADSDEITRTGQGG